METSLLKNYPTHGFFQRKSEQNRSTFSFVKEMVQLNETHALFTKDQHYIS